MDKSLVLFSLLVTAYHLVEAENLQTTEIEADPEDAIGFDPLNPVTYLPPRGDSLDSEQGSDLGTPVTHKPSKAGGLKSRAKSDRSNTNQATEELGLLEEVMNGITRVKTKIVKSLPFNLLGIFR
ncbi:hypothetical protein Zmor_002146 [Zophobas morio]|uniref:Uncharacterized protein n=1 Tax=Zophobas morio TaxID=2755281 RepID=A0AA38MTJ8_9CUCU|nr:hypothetical protein Zmor_002146 [Zophobas morio]